MCDAHIYIPPQNWRWLEWRSVLIRFTLVSGLVFAWCALGEYLLP